MHTRGCINKFKFIRIDEPENFEQEHHTDNYYWNDVLCIWLCYMD
jgi:hypothetical protein